MKKNTPSKFITLRSNSISNPKSFTSTIRIAALLFVFTLFCNTISAQNGNSVTPQVRELDFYISSLKSIDQYIHIVSKINLNDQNVINMIHDYDEKYIIFYKTLKEE